MVKVMYLNNFFRDRVYKSLSFLWIVTLILFGCEQTPKGNESITSEPRENTKDLSKGTRYPLDTEASVVTWIGTRPAKQHDGTIHMDKGYLVAEDKEILGGEIIIDILSLDIRDIKKGSEDYLKLKKHLMSDDFFYADSFPTAKFELITLVPFDSTIRIVDKPEFESQHMPALLSEFMMKEPTHYVTGNLTMRGTTKGITFPATIQFRNNRIYGEAKFNIDRTDWHISYNDEASVIDKAKDKFIYNTVNVGFSFRTMAIPEE